MSGPGPQYSEPGYAGHLTKELDDMWKPNLNFNIFGNRNNIIKPVTTNSYHNS